MKPKYLILALILIAIFINKSYTQFSMGINLLGYYDDNIFRNSSKTGSFITNASIGAAYNFINEASNFKMGYNANLAFFNDMPTRDFNQHNLTIDYIHLIDTDETALNIGLDYSVRNDKDIYNIYDETGFGFYGIYKSAFSESITWNSGYNFNSMKYPNISELSYTEHIFNFSSNFSFETRTALIPEINLGIKNYTKDMYSTTTSTVMIGNGKGKGRWINQSNITKFDDNLSVQALISCRVAQSLSDFTGIQFTYYIRHNFQSSARSLFSGEYYVSDDEIFDDHYGYGGHEFELGYTQLIPEGITLKAGFEYLIKNYKNQFNSLQEESSPLIERNDKKFLANISLRKRLQWFEDIIDPLYASINCTYQKNTSTVQYYNYNTISVFLGLSMNVNF